MVYTVLSGIFLGSLTMLNILGVSRFMNIPTGLGEDSFITLAIGVLPYPITFLCTDFISELYGRRRANLVVWVGLLLNVWVLFIMWLGGIIDAPEGLESGRLALEVGEAGNVIVPHGYAFYEIRSLTFGATIASMIAYLIAQFVDVQVFHYLKKKTKGKMLWLRNNASTLVSQLVDSTAVILITYYVADGLPYGEDGELTSSLIGFIWFGYLFKLIVALLDTIPFYIVVKFFRSYLGLDEHGEVD